MPGKLPTISRSPVSNSVKIDARIALAEFHIGDFLGRRGEPRRQHQIGALGQVANVEAVLIHQRQPLDAPFLGSALVDEYHAAVEIALVSGQALVDLVGNDVCDPPPVFRRGDILMAGELLAGGDVPQAEFGLEAPVVLAGHAAGDQGLGVDGLPALELRRFVGVGNPLDKSRRIDRRKQPAALEIVGDDLGDADPDLAVGRRPRHEIRNRDRKRRDVAFGDLQFRLRVRQRRQQQARGGSGAADQDVAAGQRQRGKRKRRHGHCWLIFKKHQL